MVDKKQNKITGTIKLRIDKDLRKLLKASEKTGVPLIFGRDNIIDVKIEGDPTYNPSTKPDLIEIGPPGFYFDLILDAKEFKNIPFDRTKDDEIYTFNSMPYSKLGVDLEIKFKLDDPSQEIDSSITIKRKSNKIKDVLNYEIRKRDFSDCIVQFIPFGINKHKLEGELPKIIVDDTLFKFYKQLNYINEKLNLDIVLDDEYELLNGDIINANIISEIIKTKKFKLSKIPVSLKTTASGLNYLLRQKNKQFTLKQEEYTLKLLGDEIKLGPYKIEMEHYEILNYKELKEIYEQNKDNPELIEVTAILKEKDCDKFYMNFEID